jgi:hypothetical protein
LMYSIFEKDFIIFGGFYILFRFIQNRLFCRVTRLLHPGHPTAYRTAPGRPLMYAGSPERNQKSVLTSSPRDVLAILPATQLPRIVHVVTAPTWCAFLISP